MAHRRKKNRSVEQIAAEAAPDTSKSFLRKVADVILGTGYEPPPQVGRNEPCWCGSGRKYKYCCEEKDKKKKRDHQAGKPPKSAVLGGM